jgi:hypothetical protein
VGGGEGGVATWHRWVQLAVGEGGPVAPTAGKGSPVVATWATGGLVAAKAWPHSSKREVVRVLLRAAASILLRVAVVILLRAGVLLWQASGWRLAPSDSPPLVYEWAATLWRVGGDEVAGVWQHSDGRSAAQQWAGGSCAAVAQRRARVGQVGRERGGIGSRYLWGLTWGHCRLTLTYDGWTKRT